MPYQAQVLYERSESTPRGATPRTCSTPARLPFRPPGLEALAAHRALYLQGVVLPQLFWRLRKLSPVAGHTGSNDIQRPVDTTLTQADTMIEAALSWL